MPAKTVCEMKKMIIMACAALAVFASCREDDAAVIPDAQDFRISARLPLTRGSADGGVTNVDEDAYDLRYILEVWSGDVTPVLVTRKVQTVDKFRTDGTVAAFGLSLVPAEYTFVLWADFVLPAATPADLHYKTADNLQNIALQGTYKISDETRDAYYAARPVDLRTASQSPDFTLARPFGKIRIVATEIDEVPDYAEITYPDNQLPDKFNALTGKASATRLANPGVLTSTVAVETFQEDNAYVLGFDYIFADGQPAVDCSVTCYDAGNVEIVTRAINGIPLVPNKLSSVFGIF